MRRLAVALLLLIAVAGGVVLVAGRGAQASPDTITVDSTGDGGDSNTADGVCDDGSGNCTLRAAIEQANADAGTDTIEFDIAGTGPHTISPGSALPTITGPVIIDGTREPDFAGAPIIELDGTSAGGGADGLSITDGSSTVKGLVINRFLGDGIELSGSGGNTIEGNYIGTDVTGTADLGNSRDGVYIESAPTNTIGGTTAGAGNVISGNGWDGVRIYGSTVAGNLVQGNYIGTDVNGTADLGNGGGGVYIEDAPNNTIGGTAASAGNVISGNNYDGVCIQGSGATANVVQGNYIGTDVSGTADLGNSNYGVEINGSPTNTIGGMTAGERNVISGNDGYGVYVAGSSATGNQVLGNYIGTDVTGSADLGNSMSGVLILDAPSNTIGGTAVGAGNVVSGNGDNGVYIAGSSATGNQVLGNFVGTDVTGTADLGNSPGGVYIQASGNTIGGTTATARNVISGNVIGVFIGSPVTGNQVLGNFIGTDITGTAALGNSAGVQISEAPKNTIGGTAAGARNVISGNGVGIYIGGSDATGNQVLGNFVGTDVTGTADLGNWAGGVQIDNAPSNTIGGTAVGAGNVISGNGQNGVYIARSSATGNQVQGNYIGTDVTGTAGLGNSLGGVYIDRGPGNTIGGTAAGAGNAIAYNNEDGVRVDGAITIGNTISGNSIHSNGGKGIENVNGGNTELAPPIIDSVGSASGHTDPKCNPCTVEVFSDDEDEGRIYHGSTATNDDATGTWAYPGAVTGPNITATITDASGNTSEFSALLPLSPPVGGIAELPGVSGSSGRNYVVIAGLAAAALVAVSAGGWYARRRWVR